VNDIDRMLRTTPINRRSALGVLGLTGASAALAACAGGTSPAPSTEASAPASVAASTEPSAAASFEAESELLIYNWTDYISDKNLAEFKTRYGTDVTQDFFASNEEFITKVQAGGSGYDLGCPTAEYVQALIEAGIVQKLDHSRIPNLQYINPTFLNNAWDPNADYMIPKDYGTTGILYRTKLVPEPVTSWKDLYDLTIGKYSGKVVFVNSMGDVFPMPLKMLGYSVNDNDPAHLEEARKIFLDLAPHILALDSDTYDDKMTSGEALLVLGWTGPITDLKANPDTADTVYLVPTEGTIFWMDVWMMFADAPHPNASYAWLNFIHEPAIQAEETIANYYATANDEAKKLVPAEILNDPAVFPPDDVIASLEGSLDHSGVQQRADIWAEFASKIGG